jgi:hypothetical protein
MAHKRAALGRNGGTRQPADAACAGPHEMLAASVFIRARVEFAHEGDAGRGIRGRRGDDRAVGREGEGGLTAVTAGAGQIPFGA